MTKQQLSPKATKAGNEAQKLMETLQKSMQQLTQQHNRLTSSAQQVDVKGSRANGEDALRTAAQVEKLLQQYEHAVKALVHGVHETKKEQEKQQGGPKKPGVHA